MTLVYFWSSGCPCDGGHDNTESGEYSSSSWNEGHGWW